MPDNSEREIEADRMMLALGLFLDWAQQNWKPDEDAELDVLVKTAMSAYHGYREASALSELQSPD